MLPAADAPFVGINWGSSALRAYLIAADGTLLDDVASGAGVSTLDRDGMVREVAALAARWPEVAAIYASGMVGSNIGWIEVPYAHTPASLAELIPKITPTTIGTSDVFIVPGLACRRAIDDAPDILRGEEIELLGLIAMHGTGHPLAVLPGTHSKWVRLADGRVGDFFTAMSGELFDRLTGNGLLASIVAGEARAGPVFIAGVDLGLSRQAGLATALFGARARVVRGELTREDAASFIRGLLIGAEMSDLGLLDLELTEATVPVIGNGPLSALYADALRHVGARALIAPSRDACLAGFAALARAHRTGPS